MEDGNENDESLVSISLDHAPPAYLHPDSREENDTKMIIILYSNKDSDD